MKYLIDIEPLQEAHLSDHVNLLTPQEMIELIIDSLVPIEEQQCTKCNGRGKRGNSWQGLLECIHCNGTGKEPRKEERANEIKAIAYEDLWKAVETKLQIAVSALKKIKNRCCSNCMKKYNGHCGHEIARTALEKLEGEITASKVVDAEIRIGNAKYNIEEGNKMAEELCSLQEEKCAKCGASQPDKWIGRTVEGEYLCEECESQQKPQENPFALSHTIPATSANTVSNPKPTERTVMERFRNRFGAHAQEVAFKNWQLLDDCESFWKEEITKMLEEVKKELSGSPQTCVGNTFDKIDTLLKNL